MKKGIAAIKIVTISGIAAVFMFTSLNFPRSLASDSNSPISLQLVNKERTDAGLNKLDWNHSLAEAAFKKAQDMVDNKYFDHVSPEGEMVWGYILQEGYDYKVAGENLAIDYSSTISAQEAWMRSKSHRDNILSSKYTEFGFAKLIGNVEGHDTTVLVQLFGDR